MKKDDLLRSIATAGYNAGFGAKLSFASYDMLRWLPNIIGFASLAISVFALVFEKLSTREVSAFMLVFSLLGFYLTSKEEHRSSLDLAGRKLTGIRDKLEALYNKARDASGDLMPLSDELLALTSEINVAAVSDQVIFSNWWAHHKFFMEAKVDWICDELQLTFFKDKLPGSLKLLLGVLLLLTLVYFACCAVGLCWDLSVQQLRR